MSDELLKRLETGHDKECAMSYGMHEHCCDCSYPARQEAAARVRELEAERDEARLLHTGCAMQLADACEDAKRAEAELRGRTQNFDDACTTLATLEAERDALRAENERLRALLEKATIAKTWGDAQACIDAALAAGGKT